MLRYKGKKGSVQDKLNKSVDRVASEEYAVNALGLMRQKGIIIDWTRPEREVREQLARGLVIIGENKYLTDRGAKGVWKYKMAPATKEKPSNSVSNAMSEHKPEIRGYKTERIGKRFENDEFRKFVIKTANKMAPEFSRIAISPRVHERTYVDAVKLSHTFWEVTKKMSPADTERLAMELAREFKARRRKK